MLVAVRCLRELCDVRTDTELADTGAAAAAASAAAADTGLADTEGPGHAPESELASELRQAAEQGRAALARRPLDGCGNGIVNGIGRTPLSLTLTLTPTLTLTLTPTLTLT
jgi:hypothetical protein